METPKFEKINQPEKEEEIILKVIIARHGPKLTAEGEKNAKAAYFDEHVRTGFNKMGIENEGGLVHVNSSNVKRAADTAEIHRKQLMQTERRAKGYSNYYDSLTVPLQPAAEAKEERYADDLETIMRMQSEIKQSVKAEVEAEFPDISKKKKKLN